MLTPGGYLMFTTHGEDAASATPESAALIRDGQEYGYLTGSDQEDLDSSIYGSTVVRPSFVVRAIYEATNARIVSFKPKAWWGFQEEWVIQKTPTNEF